jgi:hypothetical protein
MANVETTATNEQMGFEDLLSRIEQFDKPVLLQFADIINGLVYKKKQTSTYDAQLVKKIKSNIPASIKRRQKELYVKMQNNALSLPEKDELILLNSMIEEKTAEKIRLMGELAQLRHISIEELNHQLNPQTNYA